MSRETTVREKWGGVGILVSLHVLTLNRAKKASKAQGPFSHATPSPQRLRTVLLLSCRGDALCTRTILLPHNVHGIPPYFAWTVYNI